MLILDHEKHLEQQVEQIDMLDGKSDKRGASIGFIENPVHLAKDKY